MRITLKKLLSISADGACSILVIIDNSTYFLVDCGINHTFDFSVYKQHQEEIKKIKAAFISHSSLEFSGAFPFLIS